MRVPINAEAGIFCQVGSGYLMPLRDLPYGTELVPARKVAENTCMFDISLVDDQNGERAGVFFESRFTVINGGGYLLVYLKNKPKAEDCETVIRSDNLVVYHVQNKGTLAISTKVNSVIDNIFMDQ